MGGSIPSLFLWILGTVLVYAASTNALWWLGSAKPACPPRLRYRPWMVQLGRFLFYLVIPYLALGGWPQRPYRGLLSLEDMGIVGLSGRWPVTRWLEAVGVGLGWGMLALLVLVLAWVNANQRRDGLPLSFPSRPWWLILVDVFYLEVHWAFLRGGLVVALDKGLASARVVAHTDPAVQALYAGVFCGLGLIYLEWSLSPFWRQGWQLESQAAVRWLHAAQALVIALLFLITRNLWICLGIHCLLEFSLRQLGRQRVQKVGKQALEIH